MADEKIAISEHKTVNVEFEDVDLLSKEEREALELDIDMDGPGEEAPPNEDEKAAAEAAKAAEAAEKAKAEKLAEAPPAKKVEPPAATPPDGQETPAAASPEPPSPPAGEEPPATEIPPAPASTKNLLSAEDLATLESDIEKNNKAFNDGEVEFQQYLDKRDDLRDVKRAHEQAEENQGDGVQNQWEWEQEFYVRSPENAWIMDSAPKYAAFATAVNEIMATDEGETMAGPELLSKAKAEVEKLFIAPGSPQAQDQAAAQAALDAKKGADALKAAKDREAGKPPPETLGGKPAAAIDEGAGEFDWIDKLDGEQYEEAIEKLTEAQLARYEADV
jgi:hypothetical protein